MSRRHAIECHYAARLKHAREGFDVADWATGASQRARFEVLVREVDLAGRSLLDVGCGIGDLWGFLAERGLGVDYTGVDLVEPMVGEARRRHPPGPGGVPRFVCCDLFAGEAPDAAGPFDVVFCSGTLNLDLGNNRQFLPLAVARMLELARHLLVFNLLHVRERQRHGHCAYFDPADVLGMLRALGYDARIVDDYLPNDFTVICPVTSPSAGGGAALDPPEPPA